MAEPCGDVVRISAFVNAYHAGNVVTCQSHSGIIIFVQNAPIIWLSKRQKTLILTKFPRGSDIFGGNSSHTSP